MQLKKLYSNKSSFREIKFEPGMNIILARKENEADKNEKKTYNGVGKSLIVALIHFCLGSSNNKEFELKIPNWEFCLDFEINGENYTSKRNTSKQDSILLNDEELSLTKFREILGKKIFSLHSNLNFLNFRPLICRFIRPRKRSYYSFDIFEEQENPMTRLINNAYLLGLDINYILKKYGLKKELDHVNQLKRNIKKDDIFAGFFSQNKDVDLSIFDLKDKIKKLELDLKNFKVAENYQEIRNEADKLSSQLKVMDNQVIVLNNSIDNINKSLKINPDIPKEKIINLYNETKRIFPEETLRKLNEIEKFHESLLTNRKMRLLREKKILIENIKQKDEARKRSGGQLSNLLNYLETHGALEELNLLNSKLNELKNSLDKLTTYKEFIEQYKKKEREIKIKLEQENLETTEYIKEVKAIIEKDVEIFRSFSKRFYEDKPGGIEIINDEGENQNRFIINASIQDDASDGINEVKIFCFDLTLLQAKNNHNVNFLFHDSRLFSDIEPRQRSTIFKIANELSNSGIQYIASVNQDQIEPLKQYYSDEEFKKIFTDNIRLELTDESPEKKLLGVQVNMNYDEDKSFVQGE
ncbi:Uncharacterised protein [uncultured archaeon]|nr:Uncharacterised protein [uncultured archaeon]